jgi:hypothetical protein
MMTTLPAQRLKLLSFHFLSLVLVRHSLFQTTTLSYYNIGAQIENGAIAVRYNIACNSNRNNELEKPIGAALPS